MKPFQAPGDPELWVATAKRLGYRAVSWPLGRAETAELVRDYLAAATAADLIIAEVGAWSNPLSPDGGTRREDIRLCQERLALADTVGALCCVNIAGSRGEQWGGPHPDNLTDATLVAQDIGVSL